MIKLLEKNNWISWMLVILTAMTIFYFSSLPHDPVPQITFSLKTVIYHIAIFFLFAFFLIVATSRGKKTDWLFFSVLFAFLYGVSDELHQFFVPGRDSSFRDIFYNSVGIAFAFVIYYIRIELKNKRG